MERFFGEHGTRIFRADIPQSTFPSSNTCPFNCFWDRTLSSPPYYLSYHTPIFTFGFFFNNGEQDGSTSGKVNDPLGTPHHRPFFSSFGTMNHGCHVPSVQY